MAAIAGPQKLMIRLEPGAEPIAGVVTGAGQETPFTGWIELAALIESAHAQTLALAPPCDER
jgi:hypothetical protein